MNKLYQATREEGKTKEQEAEKIFEAICELDDTIKTLKDHEKSLIDTLETL